ncbi:hypothetical protein M0Q97_07570 [Candidatus Dojkabacteria bacterium]|jgi:hypothetical protein|nr:hypothetical protein [Candidatus Dojkabacteria bacterium]
MKEINFKEVKAEVRKLSVDKNYPAPFDPKKDKIEIKILNVTGKSDNK